MMGMQVEPAQLFYDFRLDDHVPTDHLLRRIERFLELESVRSELRPFYSTIGRPSVDPELMMRMLIVGYCMGIRSELRVFNPQCSAHRLRFDATIAMAMRTVPRQCRISHSSSFTEQGTCRKPTTSRHGRLVTMSITHGRRLGNFPLVACGSLLVHPTVASAGRPSGRKPRSPPFVPPPEASPDRWARDSRQHQAEIRSIAIGLRRAKAKSCVPPRNPAQMA